MKTLLLLFLSVVSLCGQIQPTFKSFNTNQFSTNNFSISLQDPLTVTNLYVSNIFVTNITANTIYTTNIYATNLYVTNIYNDITFNGRVTFTTNVINQITPWYFSPSYQNGNFVATNIYTTEVPATTNIIFTAPVGYMAVVNSSNFTSTNATSYSFVTSAFVVTNGVYYRLTANNARPLTNSPLSAGFIVLQENESYAVSSTGTNVTHALSVTTGLKTLGNKTYKIAFADTSIHTLMTVPSGKVALPSSGSSGAQFITILNFSGADRLYTIWVVPNGSSPDATTQIRWTTALANGGSNTYSLNALHLFPGDSIMVQSDSGAADQYALFSCIEVDL